MLSICLDDLLCAPLRSFASSAVSFGLVLLRVSLCPLWFKRLLSAFISENQRQKGFDLLRVLRASVVGFGFWLWLSYAVALSASVVGLLLISFLWKICPPSERYNQIFHELSGTGAQISSAALF